MYVFFSQFKAQMDDHTVLISCGKMSVLCHKLCWETKRPLCVTLTHTLEYTLTCSGNNCAKMCSEKQKGTYVFCQFVFLMK